ELPFVDRFAKNCLRLKRHFSTGNATHYGLLGLLHGTPITFYRGKTSEKKPCPYVDLFTAHGYPSRVISTWLLGDGKEDLGFHYMGCYFANWVDPRTIDKHIHETWNDWEIVPEFHREIAQRGPRFTFMFYLNTHFRYPHDDKFCKYQPEVD